MLTGAERWTNFIIKLFWELRQHDSKWQNGCSIIKKRVKSLTLKCTCDTSITRLEASRSRTVFSLGGPSSRKVGRSNETLLSFANTCEFSNLVWCKMACGTISVCNGSSIRKGETLSKRWCLESSSFGWSWIFCHRSAIFFAEKKVINPFKGRTLNFNSRLPIGIQNFLVKCCFYNNICQEKHLSYIAARVLYPGGVTRFYPKPTRLQIGSTLSILFLIFESDLNVQISFEFSFDSLMLGSG